MDFGSQVGPKLGRKNEPRQAKTGQDKGGQGKRREGKRNEKEGKGLEGKDVEKCAGGPMSLGGEGFARPLGGDCLGIIPPVVKVGMRMFWVLYAHGLRSRRRDALVALSGWSNFCH